MRDPETLFGTGQCIACNICVNLMQHGKRDRTWGIRFFSVLVDIGRADLQLTCGVVLNQKHVYFQNMTFTAFCKRI